MLAKKLSMYIAWIVCCWHGTISLILNLGLFYCESRCLACVVIMLVLVVVWFRGVSGFIDLKIWTLCWSESLFWVMKLSFAQVSLNQLCFFREIWWLRPALLAALLRRTVAAFQETPYLYAKTTKSIYCLWVCARTSHPKKITSFS